MLCLGLSLFLFLCGGVSKSSSSRSSNGNSSLPDEGGSASQVPQASVRATGVWSGQIPFLSGS